MARTIIPTLHYFSHQFLIAVSSILQLILPCFDGLELPKEQERRKALLGLDKNPDLKVILLDFMLHIIFLPYK